jgi:surfeit locus 1 family protein
MTMASFRIAGGVVRPTWGFGLFIVLGVIFLLGLGSWQLQRMAWKHALIAKIEARMVGEPVELPDKMTADEALDYTRVKITGVFHHDKELHLAARDIRFSTYGAQILTPLELADHRFILVSRGWVPKENVSSETRKAGQIAGQVTVTGIVRLPKGRGWMAADNAPQKNVWLWVDLPAMAQAVGLSSFAPILIEADATPNVGGLPVGGQTRVNFMDNHFVYAITWFSLALALLVIGMMKSWQKDEQK